MAGPRTAINVRFSAKDREEVEKFVGKGKPYPTMSSFVERAVQHWLDHENGRVVEGTDAIRQELFRGAADDLIEDRLKVILSQWVRSDENGDNG